MKRILILLWGLASAGAAVAGITPPYGWTSEPTTLDIESGTRTATGTELLALDPSWLGTTNSTVFVSANGSSVGEATAVGSLAWSPIAPGNYALVYSTYTDGVQEPETYSATFSVAGEGVPFEIELDSEVYPYQGAVVEPKVTVTYHGVKLVEGTDYTLAFYNNNAVGVGRMVITGKGAYSGTVEKNFYILASAACTLDTNDGIRIATTNEIIRYSNLWSGNTDSTARVSVKDVTVVETQGTGDWEWTPGGVGLYTFKHTTMTDGLAGEELTAQFYVPGTMTDALKCRSRSFRRASASSISRAARVKPRRSSNWPTTGPGTVTRRPTPR